MKTNFSILTAAIALVLSVAACQKPEEVKTLEISSYELAGSAQFGQTLDFTVTAEIAQNVTVALIQDGKQLVSETVRESAAGVFGGSLDIPYTKNIADGEYDVMIAAMGNGSDRAERTVKITLAHPQFASMDLVAGSDRISLKASGNLWSYTGELPAALSGYFEAKTAEGTVYTFGGSNVDNVVFGSNSAMELYSYEAPVPQGTVSFDAVSFQISYPIETKWVEVPATEDAAYPGTVEVEFKKGQLVSFTGLGDLWVDVDFFKSNGDGTYTFCAEGGKYRLTNQADWGSLRVERLSSSTGDLGTFAWDESGSITVNEAIWCLGNYNFGKPDQRKVRDGRVFSDWETYDAYCMAKIDDFLYQLTVRVYNLASYKFFCTKLNWGDIYGSNYNLAKSNLNGLTNIYTSFLVGDGNFQQGTGMTDPNAIMYPEEGIVIRFTFDVTNPLGIIVTAEDVTDQNLM